MASLFCTFALADEPTQMMKEVESLRTQGYSVQTITQIFSQLVSLSYPQGFVPAFVDVKNGHYIQESVLEGENVNKWTQMITITGYQNLTSNPNITPTKFVNGIAGGFKNACPNSFSATGLGEGKVDNHDASGAVISCSIATQATNAYSESTLVVVIKGAADYYTIQWAERADASQTSIAFDKDKWLERLKKLAPIKLCPVIEGEQQPYPSCASRK
jgi:hypothetical protein